MKKVFMLLGLVGLLIMTVPGIATAEEEMKQGFKAGDSIYVCKCGKACECGTMSYKAGKCGCGKELIKTTVTRTENGKVYYNLDGSEFSAPAAGKYVCGCGSGCGCGTVSQKPGKCGCGKAMKKVE